LEEKTKGAGFGPPPQNNMIRINIILLGKLKENHWREAEAEYLKRLSAFAKINIVELKEESFTDKDPSDVTKKKEAEKILAAMEKTGETFFVALEEKGKQFSSPDFSKQIIKWTESRSITFIIGGPLGLDPEVINKVNATLSLSPLTFTHQMTRVILLEQIYRAMMIAGNRKYHY
jgi:23S rRNA (pseudouridine1915-N3)-methyltransferase